MMFRLFVIVSLVIWSSVISAKELTILTVGDFLLANAVEKRIEQYGVDYPFIKLESEFNRHDLVLVNLETPVTTRGVAHKTKKWVFRTKPDNAAYLAKLNIHYVSLANNHLMDFGPIGINDTTAYAKSMGLKYSGAGNNLEEARRPAVLHKNGYTVYVLSYCERPPYDMYATEKSPGIAPLDVEMIKADIAAVKKDDNIVLVALHWGIERTSYPRNDQITTAHAIIDSGADAIIGHHPHVPQGIEVYKRKPIVYSLGNAVCGFYNKEYTENILVNLKYSDSRLSQLEIIPIAGDNYKIEFQPYVLTGSEATGVIEKIKKFSSPFNTKIVELDGKGVIDIE